MTVFNDKEVERIHREYCRRDALGLSKIYCYANPAYLFHIQEREWEILRLLRDENINLAKCRILEVGCGTGHILQRFLEFGAREATGIDLMENRIQTGKMKYPLLHLMRGNAGRLPYKESSFDLVMQFMCLSSVLDPLMRQQIADEMWRVLRPGGTILSYDLRPIPSSVRVLYLPFYFFRRIFRVLVAKPNQDRAGIEGQTSPTPIRPLAIAEIKKLFFDGWMRCFTVSLDFNLAGIAGTSLFLANLLSYIPFLRTHYLVFVHKPS